MNRPRRLTAIGCSITLGLAACGGGADQAETPSPVSSATSAPSGSVDTGSTTPSSSGDVVPTIDPEVPEAFLPGVGPVAVVGESLPVLPEQGDDPAIGMPAPVLIAQDFDGRPVRVEPAADGPTWLVFLAHWCPHCNDEIPVINTLRDEGRIPDGIDVIGVSTAVSPDRPNFPPGQWLQDKEWTFAAIADGIDTGRETFIAADAYGVSGFPFSVLVDAHGIVVKRWSGERDPDDIVAMLTNDLALG
ncbi:MAG: TlpA disulfide reductase family protein [Ilumatobacteraceae bacterium]